MRFSANLGFLWTELTLPNAIRAAAAAGFDAVECHWPYDVPADDVAAALRETGLPMLGLNTTRGGPGENGLSALPGRRAEARAAIDQALAYAQATDAAAVHVMAGFAQGDAAHAAFVDALRYACDAAQGRVILIEPLNHYDAPGYFLRTTAQAEAIIAEVGAPNLKLMFDCYHVQLMEGDVTHRLVRLLPLIGHVQVASVPDRGAPDHGELNYPHVWEVLTRLDWDAPVGAEYKPGEDTDATLGWLRGAQAR
ncbi:hydroxypyruvate isomerase family protein [Pseudosulfitobacter koreensis]|uniref:TIM barrel protein n=1 Tax=Pseudosulfitobacter koreensis TaxID=2968472 RepID=A0ABT1Z1K7_9RHOB|nr:TIM barrel protein [Pseudosulfitobacter koreense]MCR8827025.1 TIM barrel protein [Pseudosulfitobacter koreense]